RLAYRPVLLRNRPLRNGDWQGSVRRFQFGGDLRRHPAPEPAAGIADQPACPAAAGGDYPEGIGERPQPALPTRLRNALGPPAAQARYREWAQRDSKFEQPSRGARSACRPAEETLADSSSSVGLSGGRATRGRSLLPLASSQPAFR